MSIKHRTCCRLKCHSLSESDSHVFSFVSYPLVSSFLFSRAPFPGPADLARADRQAARQPRRRLAHRDGRAASAQVPQGDHADHPAAAGRRQGHAQRLHQRLAAKLAETALLHHRCVYNLLTTSVCAVRSYVPMANACGWIA